MAPIYNLNKNFQPGAQPTIDTRGAYPTAPVEGSSNIQIAGKWSAPLQGATSGFNAAPGFNGMLSPDAINNAFKTDPLGTMLSLSYGLQQQQNTPEARAAEREQTLKDTLAFYKAQGDEQMKYNLFNRGLTGLAEGIRGALTRYPDPATMAQLTAGVGDAYIRGAEATRGLTQLGGGTPMRYYNV